MSGFQHHSRESAPEGARPFFDATEAKFGFTPGYSRATVLEVVLGVALKTLSNYTNHIAGTELDEAFEDAARERPSESYAEAARD